MSTLRTLSKYEYEYIKECWTLYCTHVLLSNVINVSFIQVETKLK